MFNDLFLFFAELPLFAKAILVILGIGVILSIIKKLVKIAILIAVLIILFIIILKLLADFI